MDWQLDAFEVGVLLRGVDKETLVFFFTEELMQELEGSDTPRSVHLRKNDVIVIRHRRAAARKRPRLGARRRAAPSSGRGSRRPTSRRVWP